MFNKKLKISKVIFVNLDSVLGGLVTSTMLKPKYGRVDIIHELRAKSGPDGKLSDADMLKLCKSDVISTCWDAKRTNAAVKAAGLKDVRVYELGKLVSPSD